MNQLFVENLNKGRFETWSKKPEMDFLEVSQVHGTAIVSREDLPCEADGIIFFWEKLEEPIVIKTADCLPILIEGEKGGVFLHAGWKGLAQGILRKPEISMINPQRVFIGPSIHNCCFEVSSDFREHFPDSSHFETRKDKLFFDLQLEARDELRKDFPHLLVEISPICTFCNQHFHSFRRNKTKERNWNIYIKG